MRLQDETTSVEADDPARCPLSPGQLQLWFEYQRGAASSAYHIGRALRITGELDADAFRAAFERVLDLHKWLRSTVEEDAGGVFMRHQPASSVPFREVDARQWPAAHLDVQVSYAFNAPFDLTREVPIRTVLFRTSLAGWVVVIAIHHIAIDFRSVDILGRDWMRFYEETVTAAAVPQPAPRRRRTYPQFVRWHEQLLRSPAAERSRSYWSSQLETAVASPAWPMARPYDAAEGRAVRATRALDPDLVRQLDDLARREGVTRFTLLLAVFNVLVFRYTQESDVCLGVPVSIRRRQFYETAGYFINTLVLRCRPSGDRPFLELLRSVRKTVHEALRFAAWPLSHVSKPAGGGPADRNDLCRTMFVDYGRGQMTGVPFVLEGADVSQRWGAFEVESVPMERPPQYDVLLAVAEHDGTMFCAAECDGARFDSPAVERLLGHYEMLLRSVVRDGSSRLCELPMLTIGEQRQLDEWNETAVAYEQTHVLHELVLEQRQRTPHAIAVTAGNRRLTFAELDEAATTLALEVLSKGGGPGRHVAALLEPGVEMVIALLGILKAGAAYAPLDAEAPEARTIAILEHLAPAVVVTTASLRPRLPSAAAVVCVDEIRPVSGGENAALPKVTPDALAYIFYTSGSTGRPKGVMMAHRAICNRLLWMRDRYPLRSGDCILAKTPYVFDVSIWEIFLPVLSGARMLLPRPGGHRDPAYLVNLIREERVTVLHFVPSILRMFLDEPGVEECTSIERVFVSGEALPASLRDLFFSRLGAELHNLYGPTEAAVDVTSWDCGSDRRRDPVPIGHPIANVQLYVMDRDGNRMPVSVSGELCIAGVALADGYWREPQLTEVQFVRRTVSGREVRMYRTGDSARHRDDGALEFVGRMDDQVKVSGVRVEPAEIEAALRQHPSVADCVVVAFSSESGIRLAAYVIPANGGTTEDELRSFLSGRLPPPFVPAFVSLLDGWPRTATGKIDRKALPLPRWTPEPAHDAAKGVLSETEDLVSKIWSSVLGKPVTAPDDHFFQLGGDSLRALQVRAQMRDLGYEFAIQDFFDAPTVRLLASRVRPAKAAPRTSYVAFSQVPEEIRRQLPPDVEDAYPLTKLQEALVFHSSMGPDYETYVLSIRVRLHYEEAAWRESLAELSSRHDMLRVGYDLTPDSDFIQCVHRHAPIPLDIHDLSSLAAADQDNIIRAYIEDERHRRFDWEAAPLLRMRIDVRSADVVQITVSHPTFDGWSLTTFLVELLEDYLERNRSGRSAPPARPRSSFGEFVALERDAIASPQSCDFWLRTVVSVPPSSLPRRGAADAPTGRARQTLILDVGVAEGLRRLAHTLRLPLKSVLLAAHMRVVRLLTGQADVMTGLITNGRVEERDGDRVVGLFLNTVPLRIESGRKTWTELARELFTAEQQAWPHRRFPFAEICALTGGMPLDVAFNYIHFHLYDRLKRRAEVEIIDWINPSDLTYFPLCAYFNDDPVSSTLQGYLDYDVRYFTAEQAEETAGYYSAALRHMLEAPDAIAADVPLIPRLRESVRDDAPPLRLVHQQFAERAADTHAAPAIRQGDRLLTYGDLARRSRRLAAELRAHGAERDVPVGVCLDRSPETVVALLGVLESGACFVPISPEAAPDRIASIVSDCGIRLAVAREGESWPAALAGVRVLPIPASDDGNDLETLPGVEPSGTSSLDALAYVIYTSGSTGEPKGVEIPHRALANTLAAVGEVIGISAEDRWLSVTSLSFDIAILELLLPLCSGASVVVADANEVRVGRRLAELVEETEATIMQATPSMWRLMTESGWVGHDRLRALCGGEILSRTLANQLLECTAKVWNVYGPTEATIWSTIGLVESDVADPAIGRPLANTSALVLAPDLSPLPAGSPGELWLGGVGLARGYRNRPVATRERFVDDPFSGNGGRLYRTGDRARVRADGAIEYLGRMDTQVKVRGFRVEPGAIETLLRNREDISEAVVLATSHGAGDVRLTGYIRASGEPCPPSSELRSYLASRLPPYMIPSELVPVDSFPMNANGKIDREALAAVRPAGRAATPEALSGRVSDVIRIFAEVLHVSAIAPDDSFFLLGGHSLLAMRACARAEREFHVPVPVHLLFEFPTPRAFANRIVAGERDTVRETSRPVRLTPDLERMADRRRRAWSSERPWPE
jgi:amino acid adenylation domain-containing protein